MKVLKTALAKHVLADPVARKQLLAFITNSCQTVVIELRQNNQLVRLNPQVVPKAN